MGVIPTPTNFKTLTFDGENSRSYGVYITGEGVFNAPERNVEMVEIPGRNGAFALDKGNFNNIEVTYPAGIFADTEADFAQAVSDFRNFLCSKVGYVRLEDDYNPNEYRLAIYKSGLEVDHDLLIAGEFDLVFDCKPQRYLKSGETPITIGEWGETTTYTGEIAQFENPNGYLAVKSLTADIEPLQDLHGYSSPWVGGAGKNKLALNLSPAAAQTTSAVSSIITQTENVLEFTTTQNGTYGMVRLNYTLPAGRYTVSIKATSSDSGYTPKCVIYLGSSVLQTVTQGDPHWFELTEETTVNFRFFGSEATASQRTVKFYDVQLESGTSATTWTPYSNLCPITGWTGCEVDVAGVNLIKVSADSYDNSQACTSSITDSGVTVTATGNYARRMDAFNVVVGQTYTLSFKGKSTGNNNNVYFCKSANWNDRYGLQTLTATGTEYTYTFTATTSVFAIGFYVTSNSSSGEMTITDLQLELGSTATDYVPYNPNSAVYSVTWQTEAGTVYGGTVDLVTGVLTAYPYYASYNGETLVGPWVSSMDEYIEGRTPTTGAQVVDFGGTPTTYQLDPVQVACLLGHNNVWNNIADTSIEVGNDPNYVINPTRFEARPLLEVEGYGNMNINGYNIEIENVPVGDVVLDGFNGALPYSVAFGEVYIKSGDSIEVSYPTANIRARNSTSKNITNATVTSTDGYITSATIIDITSKTFIIRVLATDPMAFTYGTAKTKTASVFVRITRTGGSHSDLTFRYIVSYDGNKTITFTADVKSNNYVYVDRATGSVDEVVLHSTELAFGHPTYIDCEIGEAYAIDDGVVSPLNKYIALGSELPTLSQGMNTVNCDNTITSLKVTPKWWKV